MWVRDWNGSDGKEAIADGGGPDAQYTEFINHANIPYSPGLEHHPNTSARKINIKVRL